MYADECLHTCAQKCGIEMVGFADLNILNSLRQRFSGYEKTIPFFKGNFADRLVLINEWTQARSAVVFALSYNFFDDAAVDSAHGIISMCARGEDYHRVLKRYATELMREFCRTYPCEYRFYTDNGILSDRMLAYAAGIGFIGKNGFVINENFGSFIFIGHILLDIDLEFSPVQSIRRKCDSCEKCIKSCPNSAYYAENCFNYENCISYMSQKNIKYDKTNYIYGCDICQLCCPFNLKAPASVHNEFAGNKKTYNPLLADVSAISSEEFDRHYADSSLGWRGRKNLARNCLNLLNRHSSKGR